MNGCRTDIAPLKKNVALLSSGEPANSSTLNGPGRSRPAFEAGRPAATCACSTPTLKLSKVA